VASFCLAPDNNWTFSVRDTTTTPQVLIPDQTGVAITRAGPNSVTFAGYTFTPTIALAAVTGRTQSTEIAVDLSMPLGGGNTWTSDATIAANSTSVDATPVIIGAGTYTLTATPDGTAFGVGTQPGINPATAPTPTVTLPYIAVTLTVTATIEGAAAPTEGALVTLTPAAGTIPQTTNASGVAIFQDIPTGTYSIAATVTVATITYTGNLTNQTLAAGARALSVTMTPPPPPPPPPAPPPPGPPG
jgi:hypothetical protein